MRKAPEKDSGQVTGVAAAFGTAYAADEEHRVRVHFLTFAANPPTVLEQHICADDHRRTEFTIQRSGFRVEGAWRGRSGVLE